MWHKWWDGSAWGPSRTDWEPRGGGFPPGSSPVAVSWGSNRLDIFVIGEDGQMYHRYWNGSAWGPTAGLIGVWEVLGGSILCDPVAVSWGSNRLDIFGLGRDYQMYHKWWDGSGWGPSVGDWEALGGVFQTPFI